MLRLTATTLAGIYIVLAVWGREPGDDIEVTRAATLDGGLGPGAAEADSAADPAPMAPPDDLRDVSAEEAVRMALAADEAEPQQARQESPAEAEPRQAQQESATAADAADDRWYVTGSNVNLRAGPSSSDRVVGRAGLGDRAEPLSDTSEPWVRIRTEAGDEAWIYGRYLAEDPA